MGKAASTLIKRPAKNWNVENRAQSFLEKQAAKPIMSPRHPSTRELLDQFSKDNPEILEAQAKKDENLARMLQGMVVNPEKMGEILPTAAKKQSALPVNREKSEDDEFGYLEPEVIRPGRCTIRQALQFIGAHYADPTANTATTIAKQYGLHKGRVDHVLSYFHVFHVQMPGQKTSDDGLQEAKALKPGFFRRAKPAAVEGGPPAVEDSKPMQVPLGGSEQK